jgi:hypothetical protein
MLQHQRETGEMLHFVKEFLIEKVAGRTVLAQEPKVPRHQPNAKKSQLRPCRPCGGAGFCRKQGGCHTGRGLARRQAQLSTGLPPKSLDNCAGEQPLQASKRGAVFVGRMRVADAVNRRRSGR